jgi:muramoyltetrapeptide carboxypeptidase LdcA involved in peptidoglycan recycling
MMADREILPAEDYAGSVLFPETSEEMPRAGEVYRILRNMGERGLLRQFPALLMGRGKAWSFEMQVQRRAKGRVFDVDVGHTDPQVVIPYGGAVTVDGPARKITVTY